MTVQNIIAILYTIILIIVFANLILTFIKISKEEARIRILKEIRDMVYSGDEDIEITVRVK